MSKIVFLGTPAHGHVNPTLPVVQELVQRGEQVVYYNTEEFRTQIERTGALFRPYPDAEISSAKITTAIQDGNLSNIAGLIMRATENLLPFLLEALPHEQPDLVIFDSIALWGRMAATRLGLRAASSITHFVFEMSHLAGEDGHSLRYLREVLPKVPGILLARIRLSRRYKGAFPKASPLIPVRGGLNIMFTVRELQPETAIIDDTFRFVGPSINPQTRGEDFPFDALKQKPVVYISLGTIHSARVDFYRECFAAFADHPGQFILSAGKNTDIQSLGDIPQNFIVRPSVPQLEVLQQTDVFITHGGMNSIHEGLYYGVSMILIPQQIEQLLNARNVEKRGAGFVIEAQLTSGRVTATELRQGLEKILSDAGYGEAAKQVQQTLRAVGGYRQAADEIQAYLAGVHSASEKRP